MSPRRRIVPGEPPVLARQVPTTPRWARVPTPSGGWVLPVGMSVAALFAVAALAAGSLFLADHESRRQAQAKEHQVLVTVAEFMTQFASLDPFHANEYVDRVLAQSVGEFAKQFRDHENDILVQVARAEPTKGTTLDEGVERWNDDGSANVLVVTQVTSRSADGKQLIEKTNRWVVTAQQEGNRWKISNLTQVL